MYFYLERYLALTKVIQIYFWCIYVITEPKPVEKVSTYRFDSTRRDHSSSLAYCEGLGESTSLAVVDSQEEFNTIEAYMLDPART